MKYFTGHKLDGHKRTPFLRLAARNGITIGAHLPAATLAPWMPEVLDQNQTSSCTGGSFAGALCTAMSAAGTPLGWIPSPRALYQNGRCIDRLPNPDDTLPPLEDEGANSSMLSRGISEWGVRPMKGPTSTGANYDAEPSNVNDEPKLGELEEEATHLLVGEYEITSTGTQRRNEICAALDAKHPVLVGVAGGSSAFQNYTGGIIEATGEPIDHAVWLYGYLTLADGTIVWLMRNSWGDWGEAGNARLGQSMTDEFDGIIVFDVKLKGAA